MLKKYTALLLLCVLSVSFNYAQTRVSAKTTTATPVKPIDKEKKFTKWSVKAGANVSVVYLARNVKDKNNEPGICGGINYDINSFIRIATLYSHFSPIDIEPTWLDVKANTYEMNLEAVARFPNKKTLLYPFIGLSYNTYTGFFTGQSDYLNLKEYYKVNSTITNRWLGINFGTGVEHNFSILGIFVDYRMRVGRQEKAINIMDVCYTGGLKVRFPYGKAAKQFNQRFMTGKRFNLQKTE